ncbi:MAG: WD40 repeat domain-containing protein [Planctomycetaceae bacterium]|jgi:WD40 repeat protein|nr:WD40 repeat domain-containing protein [Planctomycetaceae bacterium]
MLSSRNNIPVQCQICGFPFAILVAEGVRPAWCPSCGAEFTCSSVEVEPENNPLNSAQSPLETTNNFAENTNQFDAMTGINVTENNAEYNNAEIPNIDKNIMTKNLNANNYRNDKSTALAIPFMSGVRRWGILLFTVSVQVIALASLPVLLFSMMSNIDKSTSVDDQSEIAITLVNHDLPPVENLPETEIESQQLKSANNANNVNKANKTTQAEQSDKIVPDQSVAKVGDILESASDVMNFEGAAVVDGNYVQDQNGTNAVAGNSISAANVSNNYDANKSAGNFAFIESLHQPPVLLPEKNKNKNKNLVNDKLANDNSPLGLVGTVDIAKLSSGAEIENDGNKVNENENNGNDNVNAEVNTEINVGGVDAEVETLSYEMRLKRARDMLVDGRRLSATAPERSLQLVIQAIKYYRELGQSVPLEAMWILGRAYVMQRWGEALVESIPRLADMAISSDGQWLWCRCEDNTVWIWDVLRSKRTVGGFKLESGDYGIIKLVFTPDFRFAIGVGVDGLVRVWNMELSDPSRSVIVLGGKVSNPIDVQISPDGRWLVVSGIVGRDGLNDSVVDEFSGSGVAWLWDLNFAKKINYNANENNKNRNKNKNESDNENGADDENENEADDENNDNINNSIGSAENLEPVVLRGHSKPIRVMKISEDSAWLVTGSDDATARVYNLRSAYPGTEQTVLKGHQSGIMSVVFSVKGGWMATGSQDNTVRVWKLAGSKNPPDSVELRGHIGWVSSLAADGKGERLVSGSFDNTIRIWKIPVKNIERATENEPAVIQTEQGLVRQLLLTRDGKILVSLGGDLSLRLWGEGDNGNFDLNNTILIRNRSLPITNIAITPDDRWLIFNYINQKNPTNSGIRLLHLQLNDLQKSAENLLK